MLFPLLRKLGDNSNPRSLAAELRRRRTSLFRKLISGLPRPVRILDVGGTEEFWQIALGDTSGLDVTLLNKQPVPPPSRFRAIQGDARSMSELERGQFDLVFSNSVIEHVGSWSDQEKMAREVRRIAPRYFIQTPNRNFPIEPHFLVPGFQFLPVSTRVWMVRRWQLGWWPKIPDHEAARAEVESIRLLTRREVKQLFPDATIRVERFLGWPKSYIAYSGFPSDP